MTELTIVHFPEGWRILVGDRRFGRFQYRVDAEEAALRLAEKARDQGGQARILVQEPHGELLPLSA